MADESILSSPNKLNRSIHRSRLNRKTKRFNTTYTKSIESDSGNMPPSNNNEDSGQDLSGTLLIMYDSEEENSLAQLNGDITSLRGETYRFDIDPNFDPFAEQRLLVRADRFAAPTRSVTNFVATQGFQPCNNFLLQPPEIPLLKRNTSKSQQVDTFDITDSELLQVCEENERNCTLNNNQSAQTDIDKSPKTPATGHKQKSIVDLILEDFCSSPASPELQQSSEESNFHFKFSNKPLRTYSRTRQENVIARKNIAEQYAQPINSNAPRCPADDDDLLSNNSSTDLSVQEDLTQLPNVEVAEPMIDLNHSQNLCENLQNLSAYFMELSGEAERKKVAEANETNAEGNGANIDLPANDAAKEPSSAPPNVDCLELNNNFAPCKNYISVEEECKGFASDNAYDSVEMAPAERQNCDTATRDVRTSLDDDDEWNDECDFLANFDMDIALDTAYKIERMETHDEINKERLEQPHNTETIATPMVGFRSESNKVVSISAEAEESANKILQQLQPIEMITNNAFEDEENMEIEESINCENVLNQGITNSKEEPEVCNKETNATSDDTNFYKPSCSKTKTIAGESADEAPCTSASAQKALFLGFRTASSKAINISKEAQERATKILQQLPELDVSVEEEVTSKAIEANPGTYGGFRTASSKAIKISKEAEERAAKILQQLPELDVPFEEELPSKATEANPNKYGGFKTASSKAIKISKEAEVRAAFILKDLTDLPEANNDIKAKESLENMQFSEWPVEEDMQTDANEIEGGELIQHIELPGFATASKKAIIISEKAKQKVAAIFNNLPELPLNSDETTPTRETFENVVFTEWPLPEVNEDFELATRQQTPESNKRKRQGINASQICQEEPSSPQRTPKLPCKSPQRSPLAHLQPTSTRSSLSELAVKTPPDYRAARGIISRKNLLSLSKKNKLNPKSMQHTNDEPHQPDEAPQTPKKSRDIEPPAPQTPPDTPTINLQEFFKSASMNTSTPHPSTRQQAPAQMRTRARRRAEMEAAGSSNTSPATTNDASLKRIEWHNESINKSASTSLNASKLSNTSFSNITKMEKNPTPKQRIARLRMYGKPPNVSPIHMSSTNNCRTSGLKRQCHSATKNGKE